MDGIIYGAMCTANQKWYIGQTTVGLENRRRQHLKNARNNYDQCVFHSAIRKHGEDAFEWTVLEYNINTHDELNEAEKYWIREKKSLIPNGYNMNGGGGGTPNHRKDITRTAWNKGKKGCFSDEARKRMSENRSGIPVTAERRKRISETLRGRPLSEERKMHISAALKGHACPESARQRIAASKFKPVLMFNRDGVFISEFPSIKDAAVHIGDWPGNISQQLSGTRKFVKGYTFRYKNENPDR